MVSFQQKHWFLSDLDYYYLDDGYAIVVRTDVLCHLWKRETTTPPRKHSIPSYRRGLALTGDVRFCFVTYHDYEQEEPGDTLTHTFLNTRWVYSQTRWFYFVGQINTQPSPSESPIFDFNFPGPPPTTPRPLVRVFNGLSDNRSLRYSWGTWAGTHDNPWGNILPFHDPPLTQLSTETTLTVSYWIIRTFLSFNTSSLPPYAKIISAQLRLYIKFAQTTLAPAFDFICLTQGIQQTPVIPTDYGDQLPYTVIGGQRSIASMTPGQYEDIELNANGLPWINPTGYTRLCLRHYLDVINLPPALSTNTLGCYSQQKGLGYYPRLIVYYRPLIQFWENWDGTLTEYNPWTIGHLDNNSTVTISASQVTIFNDKTESITIFNFQTPGRLSLVSPIGEQLLLLHHSPIATHDPVEGWQSYIFHTYKGAEEFIVEPAISRGTAWGPWGTWNTVTGNLYSFDMGQGPGQLNLTQRWIQGRILAGLDPNPDGWYVQRISIANEQHLTTSEQTLVNDYIGLNHR